MLVQNNYRDLHKTEAQHNVINDVYKAINTFKGCSLDKFYRIIKRMKYKKNITKQYLREVLVHSERIQKKIKEFLREEVRLEKVLTVDGQAPCTVFLDESSIEEFVLCLCFMQIPISIDLLFGLN